MSGIRGGRLRLKGDKPRQVSSQLPKVTKEQRPSTQRVLEQQTDDGPIWTTATSLDSLYGPIMIVSLDEQVPLILSLTEGGSLIPKSSIELELSSEFATMEPHDVSQVFVGQSLIRGQFSLKTSMGKYLSSDSVGKVTAGSTAVSELEQWFPMKSDDGFAFRNIHGKFLSFDKESGRVRADSEAIGFNETFRIRCQRRPNAVRDHVEEAQLLPGTAGLHNFEEDTTKKYVSQRSKMKVSSSVEELARADKEGRLHEALLERRMKSKHDPFC